MTLNDLLYRDKKVLTLQLNGDVNTAMVHQFISMHNQDLSKYEELVFFLTSVGGYSNAIEPIRHVIRSVKKLINISVVNAGYIGSAGIDIFLAFDNRYMLEGSEFLIHQSYHCTSDLAPKLTLAETKSNFKILEKENKEGLIFYQNKLKLTESQIAAFKNGEDVAVIGQKDAFKRGFITKVLK